MSETPRDPNAPDSRDEWLPDDPTTEPAAPAAEEPAFDQGAVERERNRKAQEAAESGVAVTHEPEPESEDVFFRGAVFSIRAFR